MELLIKLIPALVMITLVIMTRKVLLSLSVGIILASLLLYDFHVINAFMYILNSFLDIITDFTGYMAIIGFVVLIGGITSVITLTGGIQAFVNWAVSKVKNPKAAQFMTWILGLIICIDDYFNALVIGEVSKPITDRYKVSRAKLAYIIDSTSAPVVILMPLSTWGAYLIGMIASNFADNGYTGHTGFMAMLSAVPYQFYPISAIIMVALVIIFNINFGPMKQFELDTLTGEDTSVAPLSKDIAKMKVEGQNATHWHLIGPILVLVFMTFFSMWIFSGFDAGIMFEEVEITLPLFIGGLSAFIVSIILALINKGVKRDSIVKVGSKGMLEMLKSAVAILILAWLVSGTIEALGIGELIGDYIDSSDFPNLLLPLILFLVASGVAFATGTSWGAFGILIPIAIAVTVRVDASLMPIMIAATLGGSVFGDHASPVSDTTVLSSTGAQSTLHAHFVSQLPYALMTAGIAAMGYLVYGLLGNLVLSYITIITLLTGFVFLYKKKINT